MGMRKECTNPVVLDYPFNVGNFDNCNLLGGQQSTRVGFMSFHSFFKRIVQNLM